MLCLALAQEALSRALPLVLGQPGGRGLRLLGAGGKRGWVT